jgi:SAM-dependent methyltransferase
MTQKKYQDYVIKDGQLIGDWDNLYQDFADPWRQSSSDQRKSASRIMTGVWVDQLKIDFKVNRILELGCGFAWLTEEFHRKGFQARGTDISKVCIKKAIERNPELDLHVASFLEDLHLLEFAPDVIIMSQLTWYVLDQLPDFKLLLKRLHNPEKPTFLIHSLATYPKGVQTLGADFFSTGEEIKAYYNLNYLFSMSTETRVEGSPSFDAMFVAKL